MEKIKTVYMARRKLAKAANYLLDTEINILIKRHGDNILQIFRAICIIAISTSAISISWTLGSIAQRNGELNICQPNTENTRG